MAGRIVLPDVLSPKGHQYIWINGILRKFSRLDICGEVLDPRQNAGVFEEVRAFSGPDGTSLFRVDRHIAHLRDSARAMNLEVKLSDDALVKGFRSVVRSNKYKDALVVALVMPESFREKLRAKGPGAPVVLLAYNERELLYEPKEGVRAAISQWYRIPPECVPTDAHIGGIHRNDMPHVRAELARNGYDDAIFLKFGGKMPLIADGTGGNLFFHYRSRNVIWTPESRGVHNGVAKETIVRLAKDMDLDVQEHDLEGSLRQLPGFEDAFFAGTLSGVSHIREIRERQQSPTHTPRTFHFTPNASTRLKAVYEKAGRGELVRYQTWCTPVSTKGA